MRIYFLYPLCQQERYKGRGRLAGHHPTVSVLHEQINREITGSHEGRKSRALGRKPNLKKKEREDLEEHK